MRIKWKFLVYGLKLKLHGLVSTKLKVTLFHFKYTVTQIEKTINNRSCVSEESWNFRVPTIYDFVVI